MKPLITFLALVGDAATAAADYRVDEAERAHGGSARHSERNVNHDGQRRARAKKSGQPGVRMSRASRNLFLRIRS